MSAAQNGSAVDLWIGGGEVLTVHLDRDDSASPPEPASCIRLHSMIQDMARAAQSVIYHAENDTSTCTVFAMQPIEGLLAGIILLSQLSEGVRLELGRTAVKEPA